MTDSGVGVGVARIKKAKWLRKTRDTKLGKANVIAAGEISYFFVFLCFFFMIFLELV